jgi:hypothetical protein
LRHKGFVKRQGLRIRRKLKDGVTMFLEKLPRVLQAVMVSICNEKRPKREEAYEKGKDVEPLPRCLERHDDSRDWVCMGEKPMGNDPGWCMEK